jgi:hypothetical protein
MTCRRHLPPHRKRATGLHVTKWYYSLRRQRAREKAITSQPEWHPSLFLWYLVFVFIATSFPILRFPKTVKYLSSLWNPKAVGASKSNGKYAIALYRFRNTTSETSPTPAETSGSSVSLHSNSGVFSYVSRRPPPYYYPSVIMILLTTKRNRLWWNMLYFYYQ